MSNRHEAHNPSLHAQITPRKGVQMQATDDQPQRRRRLKPCPHCEASGAGCDSLTWLRGQSCCERCTGDHDERTPE